MCRSGKKKWILCSAALTLAVIGFLLRYITQLPVEAIKIIKISDEPLARAVAWKGDVQIHKPHTFFLQPPWPWKPLTPSRARWLKEGDYLKTGMNASLVIRYQDGRVSNIGSDEIVHITAFPDRVKPSIPNSRIRSGIGRDTKALMKRFMESQAEP